MLRDELGLSVNRNQTDSPRSMGTLSNLWAILIEVKNCASTTAMKSWWQQAVTAATSATRFRCPAYKIPRKGWRFRVPIPQAWASGHQWGRELAYTMDLAPDGFFLLVRERG